MNWQELCDDKNLRDLPYKIELNKKGKIEMSPVSIKHLFYQKAIIQLLETFKPDGMTLFEFPMETSKGTKVPDVVWLTKDQAELVKNEFSASSAPMICIEVLSPSNDEEEMAEKRQLYFNQGAKECWVCTENGTMQFYDSQGELRQSSLIPEFPQQVDI